MFSIYRKFPGRQDEAISLLVRAIEIDETYANAHTSLAGILLDSEKYSDAEKLYENVIKLTPNDPNAYYNYGAYFVRTGNVWVHFGIFTQGFFQKYVHFLTSVPMALFVSADDALEA